MAVTSGFFNALNNDRKYNAEQISAIFDGLIHDGVFDSVGEIFGTVPGDGLQVLVKTGKAWFHHTWTLNDTILPLNLAPADVTRPRYDAVVLEVNTSEAVRNNSIKVLTGTPEVTPSRPAMIHTETVNQYPLAYVMVPAAATEVTASNIQIKVGSSDCPFVTGIVSSVDIDDLFQTWEGEFDEWFANLKAQLSDNVVANLQAQIDQKLDKADKATDAEALAGTNDTKYMTPKKVKESVEKGRTDGPYVIGDFGESTGFATTVGSYKVTVSSTNRNASYACVYGNKLFLTAYFEDSSTKRTSAVIMRNLQTGAVNAYKVSNSTQSASDFGMSFQSASEVVGLYNEGVLYNYSSFYSGLFDMSKEKYHKIPSSTNRILGITSTYVFSAMATKANITVEKQSRNSNSEFTDTPTVTITITQASDFYSPPKVVGITGDKIYFIAKTGVYTHNIVRVDLTDNSYGIIGGTLEYTSAELTVVKTFFDSDYGYVLFKKASNSIMSTLLKIDLSTGAVLNWAAASSSSDLSGLLTYICSCIDLGEEQWILTYGTEGSGIGTPTVQIFHMNKETNKLTAGEKIEVTTVQNVLTRIQKYSYSNEAYENLIPIDKIVVNRVTLEKINPMLRRLFTYMDPSTSSVYYYSVLQFGSNVTHPCFYLTQHDGLIHSSPGIPTLLLTK